MGQFITILLVWGAVLLYRWFALTDNCYDHVKEHIRAEQHAGRRVIRAQERARRRQPPADTAGLYQPTAVSPTSAARHVWLLPDPLFLLAPTRRHVRGAIIRWTPLVSYPTPEWLDELVGCIAHFLGLRADEMELAEVNPYRKRARIIRAA